MKKVLILFGKKKWERNNFEQEETQKYQHCYEYLYDLARKEGIEMYRASYEWYDYSDKIFKNAWTYEDGEWKRVHDIRPDLIYDKTKMTANSQYAKQKIIKDFPIINDPDFTFLVDNKLFTSMLIPEYSKKHYRIKNREHLGKIAEEIKGDRIVLKVENGSGGKGVQILKKDELGKAEVSVGMTAQEFIDSSKGAPGLVEGVHDLRLVFVDDKLMYAYFRVPAKGSLLANLSQGGSMITIDTKDVPENVKPIVEKVKEKFDSFYPKIYTIDLMFDEKNKPWIVELNSMPGLYFSPDQSKWMDKVYMEMISLFKEEINKRQEEIRK